MLQKIDELIRENRIQQARDLIVRSYKDGVAEKTPSAFAELARRAGLPKVALNLLSKSVYERRDATDAEILEYGASIWQLGLWSESEKLLCSFANNPRALVFRSFAFVSQWNYSKSLELLDRALALRPDKKLHLIIQINRIEALIFNAQFKSAEKVIASIIDDCRTMNRQLELNCQEFHGQIAWYRGDFQASLEVFEGLSKAVDNVTGVTSAKARAWKTLAKLALNREDFKTQVGILEMELRADRQWETLRNFHWQLGRALSSRAHLYRVYFGTPFEDFRKRIQGESKITESSFVWGHSENVWNPIKSFIGKDEFGKLEHRLLLLLLSDLYQPWTVYRIYNGLFPDERYIPEASLQRVYQAVDRLKRAIENLDQIEIVSTKNGYRARLSQGGVLLHKKMQFSNFQSLCFSAIESHFGSAEFSSVQLAKFLQISERSASRLIAQLVEGGCLRSYNAGRMRLYAATGSSSKN